MLRKISVGLLAGAAMMSFVAPALAVSSSSGVTINIDVQAVVSIWGDNASLILDGSNPPDNSDAVASAIYYINNVDANISASVAGLPSAASGQGVQFHIFGNSSNTAAALAAINSNGYNPVGAISFQFVNQATPQTLTASTGVHTTVFTQPVVYAAGLPGDLPAPNNFNAVVTYTITSN